MSSEPAIQRGPLKRRRLRARRWVAWGAAAALLVGLATLIAWSGYQETRQRYLVVESFEPIAVTVVSHDEPGHVLGRFMAPTPTPLRFPAGTYDLVLEGEGRVGDRLMVELNDSVTSLQVSLNHLRYVPPFEESGALVAVDWGTEAGLLAFTARGLRAYSGLPAESGERKLDVRWQLDLVDPLPDSLPPGFDWTFLQRWRKSEEHWDEISPRCLVGAPDLDGDGTLDVVCAGKHQAWLLAISGARGDILWCVAGGDDVAQDEGRSTRALDAENDPHNVRLWSTVVGEPAATPDVDGDGVAEVLVTFLERQESSARETPQEKSEQKESARARVQLVSGKLGRVLWSFEVPTAWWAPDGKLQLEMVADCDAPHWKYAFPSLPMDLQRFAMRRPSPAVVVKVGEAWQVGLVAGNQRVLLDGASGEIRGGPESLGAQPVFDPRWIDVDGNGVQETVVVQPARTKPPEYVGGTEHWMLAAFELEASEPKWRMFVGLNREVRIDAPMDGTAERGRAPLVVDLNHDGIYEVIDRREPVVINDVPLPTLVVSEGAKGSERWRSNVFREPISEDCRSVLVGPDINGDGYDEVYVVAEGDWGSLPCVQALSGSDGQVLWRNTPIRPKSGIAMHEFSVHDIFWWRAGHDGWPQLVLRWNAQGQVMRDELACFSAGTGNVVYGGLNIGNVLPVDLDGDGAEELLTSRLRSGKGELATWEVTRGITQQAWRRSDALERIDEDLDGDGVADFGRFDSAGLTMLSGITLRPLWTSAELSSVQTPDSQFSMPIFPGSRGRTVNAFLEFDFRNVSLLPTRSPVATQWTDDRPEMPDATPRAVPLDVNEDGVADLGVTASEAAILVSGRTGKALWSAQQMQGWLEQIDAYRTADLDGDGHLELVTLMTDESSATGGHELRVLDLRTLRTKWRVALDESPVLFELADVDGDSAMDVVTLTIEPQGKRRLQALLGTTGATLWTTEVFKAGEGNSHQASVLADERGQDVTLVSASRFAVDPDFESNAPVSYRLTACSLRDGALRWRADVACDHSMPELLTLRVHGHPSRVAMFDRARQAIRVWDHAGQETLLPAPELGESDYGFPKHPIPKLCSLDVDGDQADELVVCVDGTLAVLDPAKPESRRWSLLLDDANLVVTNLAPSGTNRPALALAYDARLQRFVAHSLLDGKRRWYCPCVFATGPRRGLRPDALSVELAEAARVNGSPSPWLVIQARDGIGMTLRQMHAVSATSARESLQRVRPDVRSIGREWRSWSVALRERPAQVARDPHGARGLPWGLAALEREPTFWVLTPSFWSLNWFQMVVAAARRVWWSGVLVVAPLWYLARLVRRRQYSLRQLLLAPVLVLGVLSILRHTSATNDEWWFDRMFRVDRFCFADDDSNPFASNSSSPPSWNAGLTQYALPFPVTSRGVAAVRFAPAVAWGAWGVIGAVRRRWRHVLAGLLAVALGTLVVAAVLVWSDLAEQPLRPDDYYVWDGWYAVLWDGVLATSWCATLLWPGVALVRWRWQRRQQKQQSRSLAPSA